MAKIRKGTDVEFSITLLPAEGVSTVDFSKPVFQRIIPFLVSKSSSCCTSSSPTITATNQCSGARTPKFGNLLRVLSVNQSSINTNPGRAGIILLSLGEEQRNIGMMDLVLTVVRGDLGSTRTEQVRNVFDFNDVVQFVDDTEKEDLEGVWVNSITGRYVIDLRFTSPI